MSLWKLVKLKFGRCPVHFGEVGIGLEETSERVRSDTLFSAWVSAYARLFGQAKVTELLDQFKSSSPPVQMSSTFIYRHLKDKDIYYLPSPRKRPLNYPEDDLDFAKEYKNLNYLPLEVWQKWYQSTGFTDEDCRELELIAKVNQGTQGKSSQFLQSQGTFDYKSAYKTDLVPKIAVDRISHSTNLYRTGFVQFEWDIDSKTQIVRSSGLYFLLKFQQADPNLEGELLAALDFLGEEGLGGERSSGAGRFEVEFEPLSKTWQQVINFSKGTHHALISLFWKPDISPELLEDASYDFMSRGGWLFSHHSGEQLRRKTVRMFMEGSVFKKEPVGKLADVTPPKFNHYPIYRNGISLSLPIKLSR